LFVSAPYAVEAAAATTAVSGVAATTLTVTGITILASPLIAADAVSGATLSLYPNPVTVKLHPLSDAPPPDYDLDSLTDSNQTYAPKDKPKARP